MKANDLKGSLINCSEFNLLIQSNCTDFIFIFKNLIINKTMIIIKYLVFNIRNHHHFYFIYLKILRNFTTQ